MASKLTRRKKAEPAATKKKAGKTVTIIPPKAPPVKAKKVDPLMLETAPAPKFPVKLHVIRPSASEAGSTREEPTWERKGAVGSQTDIVKALNWYNYVMDDKHYRKVLEQFIRSNTAAAQADKTIKILDRVPDKLLIGTRIALMRMYLRGFPLSQYTFNFLTSWLHELMQATPKPEKNKNGEEVEEKKGPSIQDRILNQVKPVLAELDGLSDELLNSGDADTDEVKRLLGNTEFKAPQFRKIADYLERNMKEWNMALAVKKMKKIEPESMEADYAEAYKLTTIKQLKKAVDTFAEIHGEVKGTIEAVKPARKKRSRNLEKVVAKMKFKSEDTELGLSSVDPKDVMGASVVYLYNTKRRKLTELVGEFQGSIDVKRSTLIGVNLNASSTKTLRKPEEQLKEFKGLRKGSTQKWFSKIKCKPRKARARLNIETLILRAD